MITAYLGNGGYDWQQFLFDADSGTRNGPIVSSSGLYSVGQSTTTGGSGSGGQVLATYTPDGASFDVVGAWNSAKNNLLVSDQGGHFSVSDFVHAEVYLETDEDTSLSVLNVKRANIVTHDGDDAIDVTITTNNGGWQNQFTFVTGGGDDSIDVSAGQQTGIARTTDGRYSNVWIDAGAGDDIIDLSGLKLKSSEIWNSDGSDTFTGSAGKDQYMLYDWSQRGDTDVITNFDMAKDVLSLGYGVTVKDETHSGGNTSLELSSGATIVLKGVADYSSDFMV